MSTKLFVYPTLNIARYKFHECIKAYNAELTAHRIVYSKMQIIFETSVYEFISADDALLQRLTGRTFSAIIVDEMVDLSEENKSILWSRIEK